MKYPKVCIIISTSYIGKLHSIDPKKDWNLINFEAYMEKEKQYQPYHVVLFVSSILLCLGLLSFFVPEHGWQIGGQTLRLLTFEKALSPKKQIKKNIENVVNDVDTSLTEAPINLIKHEGKSNGDMGAPTKGSLPHESSTELIFNEAGQQKLYQLFEKLESVANKKQKIHVIHYGDSQIEGDRMTAYIRQRLQNEFGGTGPGLVAANNVYNTQSFVQTFSPNFIRYTCFGGPFLKNKKYGVMGSAARFTPEKDTSKVKTEKEGWIEISPSRSAYSRAKNYNHVSLYYTSCIKPCKLSVYENGKLIHEDSLINDGAHHKLKLDFENTPGKLRFVFRSELSPTISNLSLEGDFGVQVSNVAMRGSSGKIFGYMDQLVLGNTYADLNADVFIMQFGGNSVPFFRDSSSVRNYARAFQGQLNTLKRLRPSATIFVIGPSDMSRLNEGVFETYPLLPYCVQQMRKKTVEIGAIYWDLFYAMGGENSMPAWVEKGLAGNDYIHFSPKGASIATQKFFEAFASAYLEWSNQNP